MLRALKAQSEMIRGRVYVLVLVAIACIGWGLYATFSALRPVDSVRVQIAAGSAAARRFQIVESFAHEARRHDVFVDVVPTKGFEESIHRVSEGASDLASVSSGLRTSESKNVQLLAGLDIAPLHILVRRELADEGKSLIEMIRGHRVNFGQPGTNDYMLARDVVSFLRLKPAEQNGVGDFTESTIGKDQLSALAHEIQLLTGANREARVRELPDVVLTVASLPSLLSQALLDTGEYCLVPFPYVEPYLMSNLEQITDKSGSVDRLLVESTTIHKGMYMESATVLREDCQTIGLRTLLVARADLPAASVKRLMQCVFESEFTRRVHPRSPREIASAFAIHPAAAAYLDRDKPLITGKFFDTASTFFSIFGAFSAGVLSLYGYLRRRRIRRPGEYLDEIQKIDALASGQNSDEFAPPRSAALAQQLDLRLTQLKEQIIHDYCGNRVQGEMVLLSVLSILADSRAQLRVAPGRSAEAGATSIAPASSHRYSTALPTDLSLDRKPGRAA